MYGSTDKHDNVDFKRNMKYSNFICSLLVLAFRCIFFSFLIGYLNEFTAEKHSICVPIVSSALAFHDIMTSYSVDEIGVIGDIEKFSGDKMSNLFTLKREKTDYGIISKDWISLIFLTTFYYM